MFTQVFAYPPRVVYALILAVVAWFVARLLRAMATRLLLVIGAEWIGNGLGAF